MMTMTKETTYKVDFDKAQKKAYEVIAQYDNPALPINLKKLIKNIDNLRLLSFKKFGKQYNMNRNEVIKWAQSKEGCLWYSKYENTYILLYNDSVKHRGRRRFTIAHELGHYFLKHNEFTDRSLLSRNSLMGLEYEAFEQEANYFAKRLLAPVPLIYQYLRELPGITKELLANVFDISYSVSNSILEELEKHRMRGITGISHPMNIRFESFIHRETHFYFCKTCENVSYTKPKYCSICGTGDQFEDCTVSIEALSYKHKINLLNQEDEEQMIYKSIPLDNEGKAYRCPVCENEEISPLQDNCQICNTYLINTCSGCYENNYQPFHDPIIDETFLQNSCDIILEGNARYCSCGAMSTFYLQEILSKWQIEKERNEMWGNQKKLTNSSNPFT